MRLRGKTALITGAASGLGAATARRFHTEGARLVLTDINSSALQGVANAIGGAVWIIHDVTSEDDWDAAIDLAIERFGSLDILVNNAGIGLFKSIETTTLADWQQLHAVNSEGMFLGCRAAVLAMKERGGSIVNVAGSLAGDADLAAYGASAGAVRMLTKSVALHCARNHYGVRCNSVHPSFADTPLLDDVLGKSPAGLPMGRVAAPEEVVAAILFLASDESGYVNGAELAVDGGLTAG